ncbi:hemolysin-III related domain-containing protein [Sarocladium implicatum]|nr:hemolysin-III related domain-containing protein [Sarocladium implicatum]
MSGPDRNLRRRTTLQASTDSMLTQPRPEDAPAAANVKRQVGETLLAIGEVPEWLVENEFVHTGYRPACGSIKKSVQSILAIHNETVNIWSHILGCILFLVIPVYVFTTEIPPRYKVATREDVFVCTVYFLGVAVCFFLSSTYHIVANHSSRYHSLYVQFDYLGILILMYTAHIPLIYYGFACDHPLRNGYWALVTVLAVACGVMTMQPRFKDIKAKQLRGACYSAFGASSLAPIIHAVVKYGWEVQRERMGLVWWGLVAVFNIIGVAAYAAKIPERFFPGRFDIIGQSHQIMHVSVVVAAMMHVMGCLGDFDYVHEHGVQCGA